MAKARKRSNGGSTNDANNMTAKQRQQAASRAAGLRFKYHTGYNEITGQRDIYFGGPAGPLDSRKLYKVTAPSSQTINSVFSDMLYRSQANIPASKKAQANFLASEKKKSSKTVAKNVKRRER